MTEASSDTNRSNSYSLRHRFSLSYRKPLVTSGLTQFLILGLGALSFDMGVMGRVAVISLFPYWVSTLIILFRRPLGPTQDDLRIVALGYPIVFIALYLLNEASSV